MSGTGEDLGSESQLRRENEQLRKEHEQLRRENEQLRGERPNSELQGPDNCLAWVLGLFLSG